MGGTEALPVASSLGVHSFLAFQKVFFDEKFLRGRVSEKGFLSHKGGRGFDICHKKVFYFSLTASRSVSEWSTPKF